MSINETKNNKIKEIANLIICLLAHGSKLPDAAEYKAATPMKDNKLTMNIKSRITSNNLLLIFILYILSIPIIQASLCTSQAIIGWLLVFSMATVHYQVMFQVGIVEIFCLHLAYIISVATRKHKAPSD